MEKRCEGQSDVRRRMSDEVRAIVSGGDPDQGRRQPGHDNNICATSDLEITEKSPQASRAAARMSTYASAVVATPMLCH
jgi:hypothetical protein